MNTKKIVALAGIIFIIFCACVHAQQGQDGQVLKKYPNTSEWLRQNQLSVTQDPEDALKYGYILAYGEGLPSLSARTTAEKRLTAESAANVLASRNLAEYLAGFALTGERTVKDKRELYDVAKKTVSGFIKGVEEVYKEYNEQEESAVAIIKIGMGGPKGFATHLYEKMMGNPELKSDLLGKNPGYRPKSVVLETAFDGLIIDATAEYFKPALINRIFNLKGEVLYDPSKVKREALIQHGCGEYTNTVERAREALALRGAKNPLIIRANGTVSHTDIKVSEEDALKIFSANQKTGFFPEGKVAFVLK